MNGKQGWALLLIGLGVLLILKWFIPMLGVMISLLLPIIVLGFGIYGWARGKKLIGGILILFGALMLASKMTAYLGIVIAAIFIYLGVSTLLKQRKVY